MAFGLVSAPRNAQIAQRYLDTFLYDFLFYTKAWTDQLQVLRQLLMRLGDANLTEKSTQCFY